jgi:uncharacterized protein
MMTVHFDAWQWSLLYLGALSVGLSKTGVPGLSVLFIAVFANILQARAASGVVLPLLILGDLFATASYRQHLVWSHLLRLFPWTILGVVAGWFALGRLDDHWTARIVGGILLLMLTVHEWRRRRTAATRQENSLSHAPRWVVGFTGVLAGFCTLVANAAGPVMTLYLLAMRLPKLEFMGTTAVFFLLLNWIKVPFMLNLGLINSSSLSLNLWLAPAVIVGALSGRWLASRMSQRWFEYCTLALAACAAVKLVLM